MTQWAPLFKLFLQTLQHIEEQHRIDHDTVRHITQNLIDLHYCRRFYIKSRDNTRIEYSQNLTIERLTKLLFTNETHNREYDQNTNLYGTPSKLIYSLKPFGVKNMGLSDLINEEDMMNLINKTSSGDYIWVARTRYIKSPSFCVRK